jgi:hypothetical protein
MCRVLLAMAVTLLVSPPVVADEGHAAARVSIRVPEPVRLRFPAPAPAPPPREAPLRFVSLAEHPQREALVQGAQWLADHVVHVETASDTEPLALIAWWDPTLSSNRRDWVAYTITDTLWAAWALRPFAPELAEHLTRSLDRLHARSNGFMDQPFHLLDEFRLLPTDADRVHGSVLTTAYADQDEAVSGPERPRQVQVRVMHFKPASEQENCDIAATFVDPAVYYAFHRFWNGDRDGARRILLRCLDPQAGIPVRYDQQLGLLLDAADREAHQALSSGDRARMPYAPFKQALFLFAARQMGLVGDGVPEQVAARLEQRILESQTESGAFRHVVFVDQHGARVGPVPAAGGTGESTAICLLALLSTAAERAPHVEACYGIRLNTSPLDICSSADKMRTVPSASVACLTTTRPFPLLPRTR